MTNFVTGTDRDRIQDFLNNGETLLWCAKPEPPLMPQRTFIFFLLGIIFSSMSIIMALQFQRQERLETPILLILCVFLVVGLLLAFYIPFATRSKLLRTLYIISDKRAIILPPKGDVRSYPLAPYMVLSARTPEGKLGRIIFEREVHRGKNSTYTVDIGFLYCPEAAEAMRLLEKQLNGKALESSKTPEVRRQERAREDIAAARYYPYLLMAQILLLAATVGSATWLLLTQQADGIGLFLFFLVASIICYTHLRSSIRGRKLQQERGANTSR